MCIHNVQFAAWKQFVAVQPSQSLDGRALIICPKGVLQVTWSSSGLASPRRLAAAQLFASSHMLACAVTEDALLAEESHKGTGVREVWGLMRYFATAIQQVSVIPGIYRITVTRRVQGVENVRNTVHPEKCCKRRHG